MTVDAAMNKGYRPIAGFDGYVINADAVVWSIGRIIPTKGGATRTTAAKPLKPDSEGRVTLRRDGTNHRFVAAQLAAQYFPPTLHYVIQRSVTVRCRWCRRDFDASTAWWCENAPVIWPDLYRCTHCTTAVIRLPDHFPTPPY